MNARSNQRRSHAAHVRTRAPTGEAHQIAMLAPPVTLETAISSDDRCTPPDVLACVAALWPAGVALDPCWNPWSLVRAQLQWTKRDDALAQDWVHQLGKLATLNGPTIWLNPPYSNPFPFVRMLARTVDEVHGEALALVRHDSTTEWWRYVEGCDALCLVRERVRFRLGGEETGAADHASTIAFWSSRRAAHDGRKSKAQRVAAFARAFVTLGLIVEPRRCAP